MSSTASSPSTPAGAAAATGAGRSTPAARRQRVLWDSDNATRGGKTSIGVLLEWLTTPGNLARWRNGKTQTGETRETLCSEIKNTMRQHGIHHRENANIRTQISELERGFEATRVWLKENKLDPVTFKRMEGADNDITGAEDDAPGAADEGSAEVHVQRMCRYYHVLYDVFGQEESKRVQVKSSYHPRSALYPVILKKRRLPEEEVQEIHQKTMLEETVVEVQAPQTLVANVPIAPAPNVKETVVATPVAATSISVNTGNALRNAGLAANWSDPAALESTQRILSEAVREERERKRFCMEEERHKLECEKLQYEVEAEKLKLTIDRALARKKLLDAGLPESQVNELFPM